MKFFSLFTIIVFLISHQSAYAQKNAKGEKKLGHLKEIKKISYAGKKSPKSGRALVQLSVVEIAPAPPMVVSPQPTSPGSTATTTPDDFVYYVLPRTPGEAVREAHQDGIDHMIRAGVIRPDGSVDALRSQGTITAVSKQLVAQYLASQTAAANAPTPQIVASNSAAASTPTPQPIKVILPPPIVHQAPNQNQVIDSDLPKHPVPGTEHEILYFAPHDMSYGENEREIIEKKEIEEMAKQNLIGVDGMLTGEALKKGYHSTIISSKPLKKFKSEDELIKHLKSEGKK